MDLALQTRVERYDITLEVSGTPETLKANLRSPGVSQNELVSLLLTGQRADTSAIVQADIARGRLLMLLSGELLGFAGRAVGLDGVQIGQGLGAAASDFDLLATDTDPSARLTVGKHLSRNVEVVFSQALTRPATSPGSPSIVRFRTSKCAGRHRMTEADRTSSVTSSASAPGSGLAFHPSEPSSVRSSG